MTVYPGWICRLDNQIVPTLIEPMDLPMPSTCPKEIKRLVIVLNPGFQKREIDIDYIHNSYNHPTVPCFHYRENDKFQAFVYRIVI